MNNYNISFIKSPSNIEINLNSSKSESNRLLIIKSLSDDNIKLSNLSKCELTPQEMASLEFAIQE